MRLLLDTHTLLWWLNDDDRLERQARDLIEDPDNEVLVMRVCFLFHGSKTVGQPWRRLAAIAGELPPSNSTVRDRGFVFRG
jgi:hypothetical protein